jgi:hypothetical protein
MMLNALFERIGFFVVIIATITIGFLLTYGLLTNRLDDMLCDLNPFCEGEEVEIKVVDEQIIWTRITDRTVLDLGKFERNGAWRAERDLRLPVVGTLATESKRMRGTVNITMGMNLEGLTQEDITVDQSTLTITIALPPVQPVECFMVGEEFYDNACATVCDELERELEATAIQRTLESEAFGVELTNKFNEAQVSIAQLIDIGNITNLQYTLRFTQQERIPAILPGTTCPQPED